MLFSLDIWKGLNIKGRGNNSNIYRDSKTPINKG